MKKHHVVLALSLMSITIDSCSSQLPLGFIHNPRCNEDHVENFLWFLKNKQLYSSSHDFLVFVQVSMSYAEGRLQNLPRHGNYLGSSNFRLFFQQPSSYNGAWRMDDLELRLRKWTAGVRWLAKHDKEVATALDRIEAALDRKEEIRARFKAKALEQDPDEAMEDYGMQWPCRLL